MTVRVSSFDSSVRGDGTEDEKNADRILGCGAVPNSLKMIFKVLLVQSSSSGPLRLCPPESNVFVGGLEYKQIQTFPLVFHQSLRSHSHRERVNNLHNKQQQWCRKQE